MKSFNVDDELADIGPKAPTAQPAQPAAQATVAPQPTTAPAPTQQPGPPPPPPPPQQNTATAQAAPQAQSTTAASALAQEDIDDLPTGGQQAASSNSKPASGDDLVGEEVTWEDQELMKTGDGLQRIRPEKKSDKVVRFALLPFLPPRSARNHYVNTKEGKRCHVCLGTKENPTGWCCKQLDEEGRSHIVCLAIEYTNANPRTGNYDKNADTGKYPAIEYRVGFLDLSRSQYKQIVDLKEEDKSLYDVDLVMAMDGNRYKFAVKSSKAARWKLIPELAKEVEAKCQPFVQDGGRKLAKRLGKKTTLLEWKALLAGVAAGAAEASLSNMDDL
jgi:hypothetical protein